MKTEAKRERKHEYDITETLAEMLAEVGEECGEVERGYIVARMKGKDVEGFSMGASMDRVFTKDERERLATAAPKGIRDTNVLSVTIKGRGDTLEMVERLVSLLRGVLFRLKHEARDVQANHVEDYHPAHLADECEPGPDDE